MKTTTSKRLKEIMNERNLRQVDILDMVAPYSKKLNIRLAKNDLSQYVSGKVEPSQEKLTLLSLALEVNEPWLMGYDVKKERGENKQNKTSIPLIGTIAAGTPILAEQNIERYFDIDTSIHCDFCLRIQGDSMIDVGIHDDDIVFIRQQPTLEIGEIGAIQIGEEATLKRFYKTNDSIILQPANSDYLPQIYTSDSDIKILGKLVATLHMNK
ncbi:transcriptional repressor LexA [Finegoldia magna]|uniref:transcriptional repressor LexA n=1 Tax=Finegoldia magna TaxID=1260 RepID=UPI002901A4A8|nr:transcriptional repressor LexA [Finegoldia magna]MDU1212711.1 transcriptional repressor LexA [Finegoldia magna]